MTWPPTIREGAPLRPRAMRRSVRKDRTYFAHRIDMWNDDGASATVTSLCDLLAMPPAALHLKLSHLVVNCDAPSKNLRIERHPSLPGMERGDSFEDAMVSDPVQREVSVHEDRCVEYFDEDGHS